MTAPFKPTVRQILEVKISAHLAEDRLCQGRVASATMAAILDDVEQAVVAVHNRAIHAAADLANAMKGNRADRAAKQIRELRISR